VDALGRLRLINRMNLGMERIYSSLLMEGKPPPDIEDMGDAVRVTLRAAKVSAAFRGFVADRASLGSILAADHLLVLRHLLRQGVLDAIRRRAMSGQEPLANAAVRRMTHLDRQQVNRLIHELVAEGQVRIVGHGRGARYMYTGSA